MIDRESEKERKREREKERKREREKERKREKYKFFQLDLFFSSTEFGDVVDQVVCFGCIHCVTFFYFTLKKYLEVISQYHHHIIFFKLVVLEAGNLVPLNTITLYSKIMR